MCRIIQLIKIVNYCIYHWEVMSRRPFILEPMLLRSGIKYRNLKVHFFSPEDKDWICKDLIADNDITKNPLDWDIGPFLFYEDRYFIIKEILYDWVDMFIRDEPFFAGRPSLSCPVDETGLLIIEDIIYQNRSIKSSIDFDNIISNVLQEQIQETVERRNFYAIR